MIHERIDVVSNQTNDHRLVFNIRAGRLSTFLILELGVLVLFNIRAGRLSTF